MGGAPGIFGLESIFFLFAYRSRLNIVLIGMAKVFAHARKSTLSLRIRRAALVRQLVVAPTLIRASVVERFGTCGSPTCRCSRGEKHGPYYYLTQCLAPGKIRKFLLKSDATLAAARQATAAFNQLYDQLEELSQINTELLHRGEALEPDESPR